jgi:PKHD-type hydroxylase
MDLGAQEASLRKISVVLQLSANRDVEGGSLEIFSNGVADNQVPADIGDAIVFPSFVMHRASIIRSGVRWSLVVWLTGSQPLR